VATVHLGDSRQVIETRSLCKMKFLVSHSPISPQPSLKRARSYPVFGARPLMAILARTVVALSFDEASATGASSKRLNSSPSARTLATELRNNVLTLENFHELFDEGIDLILCIAPPLCFEHYKSYFFESHFGFLLQVCC